MSTSSDGVLEFLASVHAADEQAAREALDSGRADEWTAADPLIDHIVRHDPQSVLARVEAERRICAEARQALDDWAPHGRTWDHESETGRARSGAYEDVLRVLAWGYRGREGFDSAWAPDGAEVRP